MNAWVKNKTNGLIKDLIPPNALDPFTRVILANAVYFKGSWLSPFDRKHTTDKEFHLLDGTDIHLPFMRAFTTYKPIATFDGFKVARIPYKGNGKWPEQSFSMLIFLPDERDGLSKLTLKAISDPTFFSRHVPLEDVELREFSMPKFKVSCSFIPSDFLPSLGLDIPFDRKVADFSKMVSMSIDDPFFITCIRHKATIEVTEDGTEASAATLIGLSGCSNVPPKEFLVDRPFMFAIVEDESSAVLFMGHVVNPLEEEVTL